MRPLTGVALLAVVLALVGAVLVGAGGLGADGDLSERWTSDTARENRVNHHPIGVGPGDDVVVAPVTAVPGTEAMTDTSCSLVRLDPADGTVLWRASVGADLCSTHALTRPAIADLDRDGRLDVLVATTEEALVSYDAATGDRQFDVPLDAIGYGRPTVADVTGTSRLEVVVVDIFGNVTVVGDDGTVRWRHDLDETVWEPSVVGDVDGDGDREVLVGTGGGTVALADDGEVEWKSAARAMTMATGQTDDDPALEVYTAYVRTVRALDGRDGTGTWNATFESAASVHSIRDGDGDGRPDLYVGLANQRVVALDATTGEREWETRVGVEDGYPRMPPPVVGDLDGDGSPEVVAASTGGTVAVLDPETGRELAAYEREVPVWTHPMLADLDGDGGAEILVRYGDGRVAALAYG